MSKPRDDRQKDLLLPALDQIIDMGHPLVRLAALIDWGILNERFSSVCQAGSGQPGLPTRLVAGLFILKHMHNLSDEVLCARWIENPYYQYFCGELSFCHRLPFDRSSMTRWRTSHTVAVRNGCTNIPLAAARAQEDETILIFGVSAIGYIGSSTWICQDCSGPDGLRDWVSRYYQAAFPSTLFRIAPSIMTPAVDHHPKDQSAQI